MGTERFTIRLTQPTKQLLLYREGKTEETAKVTGKRKKGKGSWRVDSQSACFSDNNNDSSRGEELSLFARVRAICPEDVVECIKSAHSPDTSWRKSDSEWWKPLQRDLSKFPIDLILSRACANSDSKRKKNRRTRRKSKKQKKKKVAKKPKVIDLLESSDEEGEQLQQTQPHQMMNDQASGLLSATITPTRTHPPSTASEFALPDPIPRPFLLHDWVFCTSINRPGRVLQSRIIRYAHPCPKVPITMYSIQLDAGATLFTTSTNLIPLHDSFWGKARLDLGPAYKTSVLRSDLVRLWEGVYLNDSLIHAYCEYLQLRFHQDTFIFNSYFYPKLCEMLQAPARQNKTNSLQQDLFIPWMRKWTKSVVSTSLWTKRTWIIPINQHQHWTFVMIVHPTGQKPHMIHFDSGTRFKLHKTPVITKLLQTYLVEMRKDHQDKTQQQQQDEVPKRKAKTGIDDTTTTVVPSSPQAPVDIAVQAPPVPQQPNTKDCGVYMLEMMERVLNSAGSCLEFSNSWFDHGVIIKKRYDIRAFLYDLTQEQYQDEKHEDRK